MSEAINNTSAQRGILGILRRTTLDALFWIAAIALVGANVVLFQQNRALRADAAGTEIQNVVEGRHLQRNLTAATLENALVPVTFQKRERTLLITFSPTCPHCKANHNNWITIADELRRQGSWRILWVSRDPVQMTRDYCEDSGIPLAETLADPPYRTYSMLDLKVVPNTVVVNSQGVVEKIWAGELTPRGWKDIFQYLQIPTQLLR